MPAIDICEDRVPNSGESYKFLFKILKTSTTTLIEVRQENRAGASAFLGSTAS